MAKDSTTFGKLAIIGMAAGVLMERHQIDADEAFHRLVDISHATGTTLAAAAFSVLGDEGLAWSD